MVNAAGAAPDGKGLLEKMEPGEVEANIKNLNDSLRKVFNDSDVPELIQARLAMFSFTSMKKSKPSPHLQSR